MCVTLQWSLGIILFELFAGKPPFYTNSLYSLMNLIVKVSGERMPRVSSCRPATPCRLLHAGLHPVPC
jgi:hypothetical protein